MTLVWEDVESNPYGTKAAAVCARCGSALGGLRLVDGGFRCREQCWIDRRRRAA